MSHRALGVRCDHPVLLGDDIPARLVTPCGDRKLFVERMRRRRALRGGQNGSLRFWQILREIFGNAVPESVRYPSELAIMVLTHAGGGAPFPRSLTDIPTSGANAAT